MKKRMFLSSLCIILALTLALPVSACGRKAYNWYFMRTEDNTPPPCPPEFSFLAEHDAYYLDMAATPEDKVIYLTFDAGYENGNIAKILDTLAEHNVVGAFFILENLINHDPELVQRMVNEGHTVGNHTARHKDMTRMDKAAFEKDLAALATAYQNLTGKEIAPFYRPPEGRFSEDNLKWAKELGYKTIFWSFAYDDWDNNRQHNPEKAFNKLVYHLHNGEVLLLHPTSATNAKLLGEFITYVKNEGYRFGALSELTGKQMPSDMMRSLTHGACLPQNTNEI